MAARTKGAELAIRFLRKGCTNRPFYHIIVAHAQELCTEPGLELLGSYDPIPNEYNEKLLAVNVDRLQYWIGQGAAVRRQVGMVLGLAGVLPMHPHCLTLGWRNRQKMLEETANESASDTTKTD